MTYIFELVSVVLISLLASLRLILIYKIKKCVQQTLDQTYFFLRVLLLCVRHSSLDLNASITENLVFNTEFVKKKKNKKNCFNTKSNELNEALPFYLCVLLFTPIKSFN